MAEGERDQSVSTTNSGNVRQSEQSQHLENDLLQEREAHAKTRQALSLASAGLRAVLEASTDAILVADSEGRILDYNARYLRFWGLESDAVLPEWHQALLERSSRNFEDPRAFVERLNQIYKDVAPDSFDLLALMDGRVYERYSRLQWVDGRVAGRVWTFKDVTKQQRTENALREEGRMLELLNQTGITLASNLELVPLLQTITDAATELSGAEFGAFFYNTAGQNGDALQLYTLSGALRSTFETLGHPRATPILSPTFKDKLPVRIDDVLADPRYAQFGPRFGMPPGNLPVRSYLGVPVVARRGEVIGTLIFGHSQAEMFTERSERLVSGIAAQAAVAIDNARLYEAAQNDALERARLLDSERQARHQAEEQNRAKDGFLAMLGHELRNPLGAISAGVTVIDLAGPSSAQATRAYNVIARQSAHLRRIVDDLLDAARMLAGKITLERTPMDLSQAVQACLGALDTSGRTQGYLIDVKLEPVIINADPVRIDQIISNLIVNGVKYTPTGGSIRVTVRPDDDRAVLRVADTGVGIPPELIDQIFDPFVQGERSLDRSQGGLGIGLTLVRNLAELHDGEVRVFSEGAGQGSTFEVRLPLPVQQLCALKKEEVEQAVNARLLLLVEDNQDVLETTACLLELSGFKVISARTGAEGVLMIEKYQPEVAIVDVGLPDLNGYEVARRIRTNPLLAQTNLIALTGYGAPDDIGQALQAGFDFHMIKPLDFGKLLEILRGLNIEAGETSTAR